MRNHFKRRGSRGVAMVEAAILAPIFAMMMMLNVYLGGVYETKFITVHNARYYTWSNASNACKGPLSASSMKPPGSGLESGSAGPGQQASGGQPPPASNCQPPAGAGGNTSSPMFMSRGYDDASWDYTPTYNFNGGSAKWVHTEGLVVCNEQAGQGVDVFGYLGGEAGQLVSSLASTSSSNPCP